VTNVHRSNPEKYSMEHLLEWHLIYRDERDMQRLVPRSCTALRTYTDATGVNVFLEMSNNAVVTESMFAPLLAT
jgi:extracellular factor (EF) 3-hydroxypalmitic acid methyl ester biosynthesis protein